MTSLVSLIESPYVTAPVIVSSAVNKMQAICASVNYICSHEFESLSTAEQTSVVMEMLYSAYQTLDLAAAGSWQLQGSFSQGSSLSNPIGFNIHLVTAVMDVARAVMRQYASTSTCPPPDSRSVTRVIIERVLEIICRSYSYNMLPAPWQECNRFANAAIVAASFVGLCYQALDYLPQTVSRPSED